MNPGILTTVGVGITILAVILPAILYLSKRIDDQNQRIEDQSKEQAKFREEMAGRMGKLEGLLEGLREAITGRRAA